MCRHAITEPEDTVVNDEEDEDVGDGDILDSDDDMDHESFM
jgi:hypothetical protein